MRPFARLCFQPQWRRCGPQALATVLALCGLLPQPLLTLSSGPRLLLGTTRPAPAVRMLPPDLPAFLPGGHGPPWSSQPPKSFSRPSPSPGTLLCPSGGLCSCSLQQTPRVLPAPTTLCCRTVSGHSGSCTPRPCLRAVPGCGTAALSTDLLTCRLRRAWEFISATRGP